MPAIPAAGALIGLYGTAGYIAGSVIVGAAVGGLTSALAGGKIGKGMLLGAATGLAGGALGAAGGAGSAASNVAQAAEGSTIASGGMGGAVLPGITANAVNAAPAAGGGLLPALTPSLGNIAPSTSGAASGAAGVGAGVAPAVTPLATAAPAVNPTLEATKAITQGQMLSGAMQGMGTYFSGKEEAESAEKLANKQLEARKIRYSGTPGLLGASMDKTWQAPRRATFNRETGRWEYAPAN